MLKSTPGFDVLLLLDCCFAARALKRVSGKTMEVLCAVSREVEANIDPTGRGSYFTSALTQNLKNCSSRTDGLLVSELVSLLHHDKGLEDQSPNHITISGHGRPIILCPLNQMQTTGPSPVLIQHPDVSQNRYNYEESLRKQLRSIEVTNYSGEGLKLNCLVDRRAKNSFISTKVVKRLKLVLLNNHERGTPLITKQVAGEDGSAMLYVKMPEGDKQFLMACIWPGASFPTTGEIDMIISGRDLKVLADPSDLCDRLLENDVDNWHIKRLFGYEILYQNEDSLNKGRNSFTSP
jgi:hypothetical protein